MKIAQPFPPASFNHWRIQKIEQVPRRVSGSEQEGDILPNWCDKRGYRSVVLVTSADHWITPGG